MKVEKNKDNSKNIKSKKLRQVIRLWKFYRKNTMNYNENKNQERIQKSDNSASAKNQSTDELISELVEREKEKSKVEQVKWSK
jgi:hypothetical protein